MSNLLSLRSGFSNIKLEFIMNTFDVGFVLPNNEQISSPSGLLR